MRLKQRVAALEAKVAKMLQEKECAKGHHQWVMEKSAWNDKPPYIRCSACYASPPDDKK